MNQQGGQRGEEGGALFERELVGAGFRDGRWRVAAGWFAADDA